MQIERTHRANIASKCDGSGMLRQGVTELQEPLLGSLTIIQRKDAAELPLLERLTMIQRKDAAELPLLERLAMNAAELPLLERLAMIQWKNAAELKLYLSEPETW